MGYRPRPGSFDELHVELCCGDDVPLDACDHGLPPDVRCPHGCDDGRPDAPPPASAADATMALSLPIASAARYAETGRGAGVVGGAW